MVIRTPARGVMRRVYVGAGLTSASAWAVVRRHHPDAANYPGFAYDRATGYATLTA